MTNPESAQSHRLEPHIHHNYVGVAALILLGTAASAFTYASLSGQNPATASQGAAVAATSKILTDVSLQAKAAYVLDLTDGSVLYAKHEDAQLPLASLTKIPLALVVSQALSPEAVITIPYDTAPAGSAMRLGKGEQWKISNVITFTLVASSNEGANILAQATDDQIRSRYPEFPRGSAALFRMNDLAHELGLTHTYFLNVNGLDESPTQAGSYGSAKDFARLMAYAATSSFPVFAGTARDGLLLTDEEGHTTSAINTNEALGAIPGLIMGKTGYTDLAGGNLAIVFDIGLEHPVVAVVMASTFDGRFSDMKTLVQKAREALSQ